MSILWPVPGEGGTGMGMASVPPSWELQTFPLQLETGGDDNVSTVLVAHKAAERR